MQGPEFFERFNVLYNNIMSNAAPGLDAFEVSEFLTKAQLELVKNHFSKRGNKYQEGYGDSAKRQTEFAKLIVSTVLQKASTNITNTFDSRGKAYQAPLDLLLTLNESITFSSGGNTYHKVIIPIDYTEYNRLMSKPFGGPNRNQAWRIDFTSNGSTYYEIITYEDIPNMVYHIRYVKRPKPIIVSNLSSLGNLSIDGITTQTDCELDESLHEEILQRAVELAKAAYSSDQSGQVQMQNQITVGQRSE